MSQAFSLLVWPFRPKPTGPGSPRGPIGPSLPLWPIGPSGPVSPFLKRGSPNWQCFSEHCSLSLIKYHRTSEEKHLNSTCTSLWSPWSIHSWVTHQARRTLTYEVGLLANSKHGKVLLAMEIALPPFFSGQSYLEVQGNHCHLQMGRVTIKTHGSHCWSWRLFFLCTYIPFCPSSPGSPGSKQSFSCKTLWNCL